MNKTFLFILLPIFLGCSQTMKSTEERFPGIYSREVTDPTGTLWDTLCISRFTDPPSHIFTIMKNSGVQNMGDHGELLPKTTRHIQWSAEYTYDTKTLNIFETEERYIMSADGNSITNGQLTYTRVK